MPRTATITGPDGTTATMNIPDGATDEQIFTAANLARDKMAGTSSSTTTTPASSPETLQQTADVKAGVGSHILSGAKEAVGGVGSSLMQDVAGILTPPPPHGLGELPAPLENLGATLDLAGTVAAPEMTAAKVAGQVAGRAIGQSPEDAATTGNLASGAVGLAGPRGLITGGVQALQGRQEPAEVAGKALRSRVQAAPEEMGAVPPALAGAQAQESLPAAAQAERTALQRRTYDPAANYAAAYNLALEPGTQQAEAVADALDIAQGKWGSVLSGREKTQVEALLGKLRPAEGMAPERVPYADLDAAALALTKVTGVSSVRNAIGQAMQTVLGDTPAAAWLRAGRLGWKHAVMPADRLARRAVSAGTATEAFERTVGSLKDPARALSARAILGENSPQWANIRGGMAEKILRKATGEDGTIDPGKLLKVWNSGVASEVQDIIAGPGGGANVKGFLEELGQLAKTAATPTEKGSSSMARYLQHRALFHGAYALGGAGLGATGGHGIEGALVGALGGLALAGGIQFARPALTFLRGGATSAGGGAIAAKALASGIRAWSDQQPAGVQAHANVVADALAPAEAQAAEPATAPAPTETSSSSMPSVSTANSSPSTPFPYAKETATVGRLVGVDPALLHAVMTQESGHDATLGPNSAGAIGLMQILPTTFEHVRPEVENLLHRRADVNNGWDNLVAGALLYRDALRESHGDIQQAASLYHGGPNLAMHGARTAAYAQNVAALYQRYRAHGN